MAERNRNSDYNSGNGGDNGVFGSRRKGTTASRHTMATHTQNEAIVGMGSSSTSPCGACKFLRRRCIGGCIFAPHFATDQGSAKFAVVHKVFGASNVSKILSNIPADQRHEAAKTITYEAQARLSDPVYGCVSTILALQQKVASLQAERALLQNQLMNSRFAYASAFQTIQLQQPNVITGTLQPTYSNNSCASSNLLNLSSFNNNPSFDHLAMDTAAPSSSLEPLQLTRLSHCEEEDEEESKTQQAFNHR